MRRPPRSHPSPFSVRPRLLIAAVILALVGIPLGQASTAEILPAAPTAAGAELSSTSYIETRDRLLGVLPADPIESARQLVAQIMGPSDDVAEVATIELLRQAGIATINLDGAIMAMPNDGVIGNGPMIGEYLIGLTRSVREGSFYTIADIADIFVDSDASSAPIPVDLLLTGIVGWGKFEGAPRESVVAGTAVRELGRLRGQPLFPGLDPLVTQVDVLQFTLLYVHIVGNSQQVDPAAAGAPSTGSMFGPAAVRAADDCRALYDALQLRPYAGNSPDATISNTAFREAFWMAMEAANAEAAGQARNAMKNVDYASKVANVIVFLTSLKLSISPDKTQTHFRHPPGSDTSRDVRVVATAEWEQGQTMQDLGCLQGLVGIDTQQNGPMPGLRVKWRLEQEQTRARTGKLMRAKQGQGQEFTPTGVGGEVTDAQGQSDIDLEPAAEKQDGVGALMKGNVTVYASLDKDQVPDAVKAFLGNRKLIMDHLKGKVTVWPKFLFDIALDISLKAIMRAGMPVKKTTIQVEYHGADMFLIAGARHPFALYYLTKMDIFAYTCEGLNGRWKGSMVFHADETALGELVEDLGQTNLPATANVEIPIDQLLDLRGRSEALFMGDPWNLLVEVDQALIDRGQYGVVGTAGIRIGSSSIDLLLFFDTTPDLQVQRLDKQNATDVDEFCPNSESYFP